MCPARKPGVGDRLRSPPMTSPKICDRRAWTSKGGAQRTARERTQGHVREDRQPHIRAARPGAKGHDRWYGAKGLPSVTRPSRRDRPTGPRGHRGSASELQERGDARLTSSALPGRPRPVLRSQAVLATVTRCSTDRERVASWLETAAPRIHREICSSDDEQDVRVSLTYPG